MTKLIERKCWKCKQIKRGYPDSKCWKYGVCARCWRKVYCQLCRTNPSVGLKSRYCFSCRQYMKELSKRQHDVGVLYAKTR